MTEAERALLIASARALLFAGTVAEMYETRFRLRDALEEVERERAKRTAGEAENRRRQG